MSPQMFIFSVMMYSVSFLLTLLKFPMCYFIFIIFCDSIPNHVSFPTKLYVGTCWAIIAHPALQTFIIIQGRMLLLLISIELAFRILEMNEIRVYIVSVLYFFYLTRWPPHFIHVATDNGISSWQYNLVHVCAHFPYLLPFDRHLQCFHSFNSLNGTSINIRNLFFTDSFISFGCMPSSGMCASPICNLLRNFHFWTQ